MSLGKAIKICRTQKDISQTDLAKRVRLSVSYISLLERDKRDPSISTVHKIAQAMNIPMSILMFLGYKEELLKCNPSVAEKLSFVALQMIQEPAGVHLYTDGSDWG